MDIKIKYFSGDYPELKMIDKGDWVDLRIDRIIEHKRWNPVVIDIDENNGAELVEYWQHFDVEEKGDVINYKKGDILFLGLGVAMELPEGHEALVAPRSSTFKNAGLTLTNSIGVIDSSYCGDNDEWKAMVTCTRDGQIKRHQRLFQFRIIENQPPLNFVKVDKLKGKDRGGFGSTGR